MKQPSFSIIIDWNQSESAMFGAMWVFSKIAQFLGRFCSRTTFAGAPNTLLQEHQKHFRQFIRRAEDSDWPESFFRVKVYKRPIDWKYSQYPYCIFFVCTAVENLADVQFHENYGVLKISRHHQCEKNGSHDLILFSVNRSWTYLHSRKGFRSIRVFSSAKKLTKVILVLL